MGAGRCGGYIPEVSAEEVVHDGEGPQLQLRQVVPVQGQQAQAGRQAHQAPVRDPRQAVVGEDQLHHRAGAHRLGPVLGQVLSS